MTLLILGDAERTLKLLGDESHDCCVTSPPYFGQRDYQSAGQIGQEHSVREYLQRLWLVFDEVMRVLVRSGTLWVNIGDTYRDKCCLLVPERFVLGMVKRGWLLRQKICWHKPNCKPESVKSRFTCDFEMILFFVKNKRHYFAQQFEPYCEDTVRRCEQFIRRGEKFDAARHKQDVAVPSQAPMRILERFVKKRFVKNLHVPGQSPNGMHVERNAGRGKNVFSGRGRNMRSMWSLATAQYRGLHFATFPRALAKRMIRAGCPQGGRVLDCFVGAGASMIAAEDCQCSGTGIDISETYLALANQEILKAREKRAKAKKR